MLEKIDHLGLAVAKMDQAGAVYEALGIPRDGVEEVAEQKVKVAFYQVGESRIELLEPTTDDSPVAKYMAKRGEGLHHVAFKVTDVEEALKVLVEKGFRLIDESPRIGAGGMKIAFVHPKSTHGLLIELCEGHG